MANGAGLWGWVQTALLDDAAACEHFKAMPNGEDWDLQVERNARGCWGGAAGSTAAGYCTIRNSTRRFWARPESDSLSAIGLSGP